MAPSSFREEYELVESYMREKPLFIAREETLAYTVTVVWQSTLVITVFSILVYIVISSAQPKGKDEADPKRRTYKMVYQTTNLFVNVVLAVMGWREAVAGGSSTP